MNNTLKTVLISFGTSLVVSLITFILGLRSGKNQTDRKKLQDLYKHLYSHFADLKKSLQEDRCKTWENYDHIDKRDKTIYTPPVKKLELSGDLIYLKQSIARKASKLEIEVMNFGFARQNAEGEIHAVLLDNLSILQDGYEFANYGRNRNDNNCLNSANPTNCKTYRSYSYRDFFNPEHMRGILDEWADRKSYALAFHSKGNPPEYSFCLYPDGLSVTTDRFVSTMDAELSKKVSGYSEAETVKHGLIKDIDKLLKRLRKRAKEPFTFWETFFGAFADLFR